MNPYQILGISSDATDDEVKKAYRTLSKKYHPDANINNPNQAAYTEKFKEVQTAYKTIMDQRKQGFTNQSYGSQGSTGSYQYTGNDQAAFQEAAGFIQASRFQEALQVLEQIRTRNSTWFYYSAIAMNGIGNNAVALEYAQAAVNMEPMNLQYIMFLQQLQGRSGQYRTGQQQYGGRPSYNPMSCCYTVMMVNVLANCCCGVRIC